MARARAHTAMVVAGYDPEAQPIIYALVDLAASNPGIDHRNYYTTWQDKDGRKAYQADCRRVGNDWKRVKAALAEAAALGVDDALVLAESKSAYSGRLSWTGTEWEYTAGQYYNVEYRQAVAVLLERACMAKRASLPPKSRVVTTIRELAALNHENGGHWFDKSSMRFFGTSFESGIIRGKYFVTSEKPPHGPRKYTVRSFDDKGNVHTVGDFCGYGTRAEAMANVPKD